MSEAGGVTPGADSGSITACVASFEARRIPEYVNLNGQDL